MLTDTIEPRYFEEHQEFVAESDKAWDAIHRALTDGHLAWTGGTFPLNHVVLGGRLLCDGQAYVMSLKTAEQVRQIAAALAGLTEAAFRIGYGRIDTATYGAVSDDDATYAWDWLQEVRDLFDRAAAAGRPVLFTADQ